MILFGWRVFMSFDFIFLSADATQKEKNLQVDVDDSEDLKLAGNSSTQLSEGPSTRGK